MAFSTFHYILNETYRWREKPLQPLRGGEISYATLCLHWAITCSPKRLLILGEREASYILLGASCCFLQLSASYVKVESFFGLAIWGVTSLITGESRVIAFDSFDVTAECDTTVIRDEMP